jgi:hypothetical protein
VLARICATSGAMFASSLRVGTMIETGGVEVDMPGVSRIFCVNVQRSALTVQCPINTEAAIEIRNLKSIEHDVKNADERIRGTI